MSISEAQHYEQGELWGDEHVFSPEHHQLRFEELARLVPTDTRSVLDVGAGDGRVIRHLAGDPARADVRLVATDRSFAAVRLAPGWRVQSAGERLPFRDSSFATVLCTEVLEHLPQPSYDVVRTELERVAAERIVVTVPNREPRRRAEVRCQDCGCAYHPDRHLRSFSPEDLEELFATFRLERTAEFGPRQPFYPRFVRQTAERFGVIRRPGSPTCPQCAAPYRYAAGTPDASRAVVSSQGYRRLRRFMPTARRPYWLAGVFVPR